MLAQHTTAQTRIWTHDTQQHEPVVKSRLTLFKTLFELEKIELKTALNKAKKKILEVGKKNQCQVFSSNIIIAPFIFYIDALKLDIRL